MTLPAAASIACLALGQATELPTLVVDRDDVRIDRSVRVVIPEGTVIEDAQRDGVIHVVADGVTVEFAQGSELLGAEEGTPWETLVGVGVVVDGHSGVTLRGVHAHRFKVGILARDADGLTIENCDVAGGYAMKLGSTPAAEDSADWLWPHRNDQNEWMDRYGAGIWIEDSSDVTVRGCFARRRQNGIVLDNVHNSKVYDNDMSFLSGWGLAMWRSSDNTVTRNAFDFCVRGYSHGVYNRGQDSAGILMFEQCSRNTIAENSCTHGGDGIFAFAGREALGEEHTPDGFDFRRRGNNDNLFIANDLSYAPAHGLEITFSFGNKVLKNRFAENAITGVWGGYSQDTLIAMNDFARNGQAGYGLERGGVNIEHGSNNAVRNNTFDRDAAGIHLWTDPDEGIRRLPWAQANYPRDATTLITENTFIANDVAIHLRDAKVATIFANDFQEVAQEIKAEGEATVVRETGMLSSFAMPEYAPLGQTTPVGARKDLRGRENIVMGDYFPWDHREPLLRKAGRDGGAMVYELFGVAPDARLGYVVHGEGLTHSASRPLDSSPARAIELRIVAPPGAHPYTLEVHTDRGPLRDSGTIVAAEWQVAFFDWQTDPREDLEAWRAQARAAPSTTLDALRLRFAHRGPSHLGHAEGIATDRFGTIARTTLPLTAGRWRFTTLSDDGVRVTVDGETVIENWTHHGPTRDSGEIELPEDRDVAILVEHFELDGYAVLELDISPADPRDGR